MSFNIAIKWSVGLLASLAASCAYCDETTVTVGLQKLSIPYPTIFADMGTSGKVMKWGEAFIEPNIRLLSVFLEKNGLEQDSPVIERYVFVKTPMKYENAVLGISDFRDIKVVLKNTPARFNTIAEQESLRISGQERQISKLLDAQIEHMSAKAPLLIEVQRDDDSSYGFTYSVNNQANVDGKQLTWITVSCGNVLLLKGKLLMINLYSRYRSAKDIQWVRDTCREFTNGIVSAN